MTSTTYDETRAEAFAGRMLELLNGGALTVMISVGHRTGLFDALGASDAAVTSQELADAAGLDERYVREWLGAMTTGRVVELDPETGRYGLPAEHARWLTRAAAPDNLAVTLSGSRRSRPSRTTSSRASATVAACPTSATPVPRGDGGESDQTVLSVLFTHILPLVPGHDRAAGGGSIASSTSAVAAGARSLMLAERFPTSTFHGYDLSAEAIAVCDASRPRSAGSRTSASRSAISAPSTRMPSPRRSTSSRLRRGPRSGTAARVLKGIRRALEPGGTYLMQDIQGSSHVHENIDHRWGPFLYTISCMHCMTVSLAQGGEGLGAMWGEQKARELLAEAGFTSVDVHLLEHDPFNAYFVVRP